MNGRILSLLREACAVGRTAVLCTDLRSGAQAVLFPLEEGEPPVVEALEIDEALRRAALGAAEAGTSGAFEAPDRTVFLRVYAPPVRLIIVGAVHVAQPLAAMARAAGLDVVVVDPRRAFASEERFPATRLVHAWPDEALADLAPDRRTAVVTLTHDPKLDDPALRAAIGSPAFYVGALGSRRTHERRRARLREAGLEPGMLDQIHGPVGLDIGAKTPGEIAVSILSEIVATLRAAGT